MSVHERTHASFFSGVGGLDLGLERAGWRTVSFSEIDPYASAVLAERWPGVPNLGDVVRLNGRDADDGERATDIESREWHRAALWTGGFPCQDLSVAGKRRGMVEGSRSNLAHAFLDLVERHRPPAILLENVPGLLSSHRGRDMAVLTGRLAELGYGVAYRVLDARHFGVPQRRRRVFILGLRSEADDPTGRLAAECAAAVLAVGARCPRHPATGGEAGPEPASGAGERPEIVGAIPAGQHGFPDGVQEFMQGHFRVVPPTANAISASAGHHGHSSRGDGGDNLIVSPAPDPSGVRATDGLAGRLDGGLMGSLREHVRPGSNTDYTVVQSLDTKRGGPDDNEAQAGHLVAFVKAGRAQTADDGETWREGGVMPTLNAFDVGDVRTTAAIVGTGTDDDPLLPLGLDSHRYRCCGNGVVANVSEWIGRRLEVTP
jgi:site-specific DNA-cytosine methylase